MSLIKLRFECTDRYDLISLETGSGQPKINLRAILYKHLNTCMGGSASIVTDFSKILI